MTKVTLYYCKNFNNPETAMLEKPHVGTLENNVSKSSLPEIATKVPDMEVKPSWILQTILSII